ncbi:protein TIFY 10A-like [Glycine soja]|uniref:Protein TIFY n=1 Tax=Glycine soja TaxID=3848 RepID=A0A445KUN2_GLYSO|nr:protein TIFY 10A-like [Glycine soja]RZC14493.1 Protein TIFY 10B [Glycine soja]
MSSSLAEKSTFSRTCTLLRQYLKEKGSFGDLTLGIALPCTNGSPDTSCHSATTMQSVYSRHLEIPTFINPSSTEKEAKAAQLTIFYDGQVVVFDDFPADKVQEMMSLALATKGISQSQNSSAYAQTHNQQGNNHPSSIPNIIPQAPSTPIVNDMPIARKASLHRFLEKRKDRIAAKSPYQTNSPISAPNKQAESLDAKPHI